MTRIEVNVMTGETKVIPLTPEEIADALVRTEAEKNLPPSPAAQLAVKSDETLVTISDLRALGLI